MTKIPYTWKTSWFINQTRRSSLLSRKTVIALFSSIEASKTDDPSRFAVLTDPTFTMTIPDAIVKQVTSATKVGTYIPTGIPIQESDRQRIDKEYLMLMIGDIIVGLHADEDGNLALITLSRYPDPPFSTKEWMVLRPGDIENYTENQKKPIVTTYGRYLANYRSIASVFVEVALDVLDGPLVYVNNSWNIKKIEAAIADLLIDNKVTVEQCNTYIDHGYSLSVLGELCGACFSRKSVIPSEDVAKLKTKLLEEHKKDLKDPRVMAIIENELISADKKYLKDDPAMDFLGDASKKFNIHRKRQYLTVGMLEEFGAQKGQYVFVKDSLSDGWNQDSFPLIMDETRRGFYGRAVETQVGGVDTKFMVSVFQGSKITEEDCMTDKYLSVTIAPGTESQYLGQYVVESKNTLVALTKDNVKNYIGKPIKLRSLMYCKTQNGYCRTCAGEIFKRMQYNNIGALPVDVGGVFLSFSMESMHGTKVTLFDIKSVDDYIVNL